MDLKNIPKNIIPTAVRMIVVMLIYLMVKSEFTRKKKLLSDDDMLVVIKLENDPVIAFLLHLETQA